MTKVLTYVEVEVDYCSLTYGVLPCTASIPATGDRKCFNTLKTCQDRPHFTNAPVTLRFAKPGDHLPRSIEAIPSIEDVNFTPATISLGEDLGQRASLTITFADHRHSDTGAGFDKYWPERGYDPFRQGTFWGKFRARQPFLRGRAIRLIRGEVGQVLADMETRHFVIESTDGPSPDGRFTITAKDALKMADDDRAQAPRLSKGFLVSNITAAATSATLSPAGIGNLEYPASGLVAIGGKEICAFTRSGDVLTLTRGQWGTEAVQHDAQDRVQLCLHYNGRDPADIIADLLQNYASVPASWIPLSSWKSETSAFLRRLYTSLIPEPTGVNKLVSELVQQAALAVWWDDVNRLIRLQVLRQIPTNAAVIDDTITLENTLRLREQPNKRISQVQTYFGQINPLKKVDDPDNYRSSALTVDLAAETDYGTPAIKRIYARWIPALGRLVALRVNDIQLGRFRDAPRRFNLGLFRAGSAVVPVLGRGYRLKGQPLQTDTGAPDDIPIQITRINPGAADFEVEAEELRFVSFDEGDLDNRVLIVDADQFNINMRTAHDAIYPAPVSGDEVTCIIEEGVKVGSASVSLPAFDVGSWPNGVTLNLIVRGRIQGAGGRGFEQDGGLPGESGGTALYCREAINITMTGGEIWGGGGGGASRNPPGLNNSFGGGGGQGYRGGAGGASDNNGFPGTPEAPGLRGDRHPTHGRGGEAGQPGNGPGAVGAGGRAIDGVSFLTVIGAPGNIRGMQVN